LAGKKNKKIKKQKPDYGPSLNQKSKYLICKASVKTQARLAKAAETEKRPISNLVCIIVEGWLDDNEIEA
jgi:hypothetical protein